MGRRVGGAGWRCPHPTPPCKPAGGSSEVQTWQEEPGGDGGELGEEKGDFKRVKGRVRLVDGWKEEGG